MPNLTSVGITAGVPSSGTGTVSTLDALMADGGQATIGAKADVTWDGSAAASGISIWRYLGTKLEAIRVLLAGTLTVGTHAVTGSGNFASTVADGANVTLGAKADAKSTATDTTSVSAMSVWKQISASVQAMATALGSAVFTRAAGAADANTLRVTVDSGQLATLQTAAAAMSANYTLVGLPTDQAVPNKVQAQSSGTTASRVNAAASTNATSLKASAGNIYEIDVFNVAAYDVFLKLYNKASAPTVGTDTPVLTIPIKAGTGYSKSFHYGRNFATGIAYAITKLQADSDTTVVVAGDLTGSIGWI